MRQRVYSFVLTLGVAESMFKAMWVMYAVHLKRSIDVMSEQQLGIKGAGLINGLGW